jgi:hypothetical protein
MFPPEMKEWLEKVVQETEAQGKGPAKKRKA